MTSPNVRHAGNLKSAHSQTTRLQNGGEGRGNLHCLCMLWLRRGKGVGWGGLSLVARAPSNCSSGASLRKQQSNSHPSHLSFFFTSVKLSELDYGQVTIFLQCQPAKAWV